MENDIPKIDLPQDWVIGKLSEKDLGLLSLYANYPCRLKAGVFVLCLSGEVEASINLTQFKVEGGSFITILPGTIFQIHKIAGNLQIYFMGFSSDFISQANVSKSIMDMHYIMKNNPICELKEGAQSLLKDYFELLIKTYQFCAPQLNRNITNHLFSGMLMGLGAMYKDTTTDKSNLSKAEQIGKNFIQLVMQNYTTQRNVAWYAKRLGITQAHLSTIVKQTTGKTCVEIITSMVIMDAKAQLKSTHLSIHDIAYALNFTNMSFFGKYFKRHVGMSPQEYRNS
ncbi:helix-turn-helix domain-containing protein [Parabacteroides sp.]